MKSPLLILGNTGAADLLGLRLRANESSALKQVERALRGADGSIRAAARTLGVHEGSLCRWLRLPQLAGAAKLRQGREAVGERAKTRSAEKLPRAPSRR